MFQILIMMLVCFLMTLTYTAVAGKFTKRKIILFLPTVIVLVWFLSTLYWYFTKTTEGFEDLTIYLVAIFAIVIITTNIFSSLIFLKGNKKRLK